MPDAKNTNATMDQRLEAIARETLEIPTLATQMRDSLDFHDVAVWSLRAALLAAYRAGQEDGPPPLPLPHRAPCPRCGAEITLARITKTT